jgi:hypothetical protein
MAEACSPGFFPGSWFIITNLYNVGLFYFNAFLLYPKLLNKKKWWLYVLCHCCNGDSFLLPEIMAHTGFFIPVLF